MKVSECEFKAVVQTSKSKRAAILNLGYSPTGINYTTFDELVKRWNVDCSHFLGQAISKGQKFPTKKDWKEVLVQDSEYRIGKAKNKLIEDGLLKNVCYICNMEPFWQNQSLVLVLDHINGDKKDHRKENLRLLCPNCNSQAPTFAGRNVSGKFCQQCNRRMSKIYHAEAKICKSCDRANQKPELKQPWYGDSCECGNKKNTYSKKCVNCEYISRKGQERISTRKFNPSKSELQSLVWEMPMTQLGKMFGVSDKAVAKRCKKLCIELPPTGYWAKSEGNINNLTKEQLEQMVSEMPLTKIAKIEKIGVSSIRRACKNWGINTPEQGYWQKRKIKMFDNVVSICIIGL